MKNIWRTDSYPVGPIWIAEEDGQITHILLGNSGKPTEFNNAKTAVIEKADKQLKQYFDGKRKEFDLPLLLHGTDFQKSVWSALLTIPYGETCSYKDIAVLIGNRNACRAVGLANGRNPISIIVPCHRIIGSNGGLTGYGGGIEIKQALLKLEKTGLI